MLGAMVISGEIRIGDNVIAEGTMNIFCSKIEKMKTTDVPQDDANMLQGKFREPVYSLDAEGNYTTVKSVGWDAKNEVMKEAWGLSK